jgi:hypothetical protein
MYHPELFPELAKNNYKGGPLRILHDEKVKKKTEETQKLKEAKRSLKEHRLVAKLNLNEKDNLAKTLVTSALKSRNISDENYTSKYEIQPLIDEMKEIAIKYLLPNFESDRNKLLDRIRREVNAEQRGELLPNETTPLDELTFNIKEFSDRDSFGLLSYPKLLELYKTHVNKHSQVDLQEMMIEMKEKGMINIHTNIKISDDYLNIHQGEKIYSDHGIALKLEYEEMLEKMNDFTDEEISSMLSQYHLKSKEELIAQIQEEISCLDQEIMIKYLGLHSQEKETS